MSTPAPAYDAVAAKAWPILSIVLGLCFFAAFTFWHPLLEAGGAVWGFLRHLASPLI
jgi:hypothetical protein